ncbi:MAG TPA: AgmX/PglI C-terminal domain-containing protein [Myxococcota bacterium]|nr:AgmX/PglI C-terminal domain-containing protein [Myxococcota bacterium]
MRFTCKKCQTPYTISDDKIRGKVIKVRCKRCNHLIVIRSHSSQAVSPLSGAGDSGVLHDSSLELEFEHAFRGIYESGNDKPTPSEKPVQGVQDEWFYGLDGSEDGPLDLEKIKAKIRDGSISEEHFVWREGMTDWVPLEDVPDLSVVLHSRAQHRPPVPAPGKKQHQAQRAKLVEREREDAILLRKGAQLRLREEDARQQEREKGLQEARRLEAERAVEEERKKKKEALEEFRRRKEEEDLKLQRKQESFRREQERKRREEGERQKQATETARKREEQERKQQAEETARKREEQERKKQAEEAARKHEEEESKKRAQEEEQRRGEVLSSVLQKRDEVRAGRKTDRIAQHFFTNAKEGASDSELLPPPPVASMDDLAERLHAASIEEEYQKMQADPIALLRERDQPGMGEISKVSKVLIKQAGVSAKGRRLGVTAICIIGVVGMMAGILYLAVSRGWFSGIGSDRLVASARRGHSSGDDPAAEAAAGAHLSVKDSKRLRSALWDVKREAREAVAEAHARQGTGGARMPVSQTEREKELMAFYESQSSERDEVSPRGPRGGPLAAGPAKIELPAATGISPGLDPRASKIEVTPQGPQTAAGPGKLTDFQVKLVIRRHYRKVKNCLERQLKRDAAISGKMYIVTRVSPSGKVQSVRIDTPKFHGTFVEECLVKEIKHWRFPSFCGETYDLTFPLLLSAQQSY